VKLPDVSGMDFSHLFPSADPSSPGSQPPVSNLVRMLTRTGGSLDAYWKLGMSLATGNLPPLERELVILRVAALTDSAYERFHHEPMARALGCPDGHIKAIADVNGNLESELPAATAALVHFVDQVVAHHGYAPAVNHLGEYFDDDQIATFTLLIGHYLGTAIFLTTTDVPLDDKPASVR
jgi:alkylhydroperoxidase family enzyme